MTATRDGANAELQPERIQLRSLDISAERRDELLRLFPEIRTEDGQIDFERLRLALGGTVDVGKERYGLTWPGKAECFKVIQTPSLGTLRPSRGESVNFDATENLIIEGDNLEVLKLLQKSYLGKVKMIYIDPPYNTGNDFIYLDDFRDPIGKYLELTGAATATGKRFATNVDLSGRYHSNWLNMMWPRLYLARQLLRQDGVLFVSIDDNEDATLRLVLDAIFGEENRVSTIIWDLGTGSTAGHFTRSHESVLCYARDKTSLPNFVWRGGGEIEASALKKISKVNPASEITFPAGMEIEGGGDKIFRGTLGGKVSQTIVSPMMRFVDGRLSEPCTVRAGWAMRSQILRWIAGEETWDTKGQRVRRFFFSRTGLLKYEKERTIENPKSVLRDIGSTSDGGASMVELGFAREVFDFPKPPSLPRRFAELTTDPQESEIILDFFAGSGATAHAVLSLNAVDDGNRRFVLVQLPEPTGRDDLRTIADICKERVRRAAQQLNDEAGDVLDLNGAVKQDRGFRVFKLAESNFKTWEADKPIDADSLAKQLDLHVEHIRDGRTPDDLLYEILLKSGFPLTTPVEKLTLAATQVYSVAGGALLVCLERGLALELIRAIAERKPQRVVCLDAGFAGNDQLKANAAQIFASKGIPSFKTV